MEEEKLYQDNYFVNDYHLSRHCIGLSGMKFTDEEIEELARRIRNMKEHGTHLCCSIGFLTEKQANRLPLSLSVFHYLCIVSSTSAVFSKKRKYCAVKGFVIYFSIA